MDYWEQQLGLCEEIARKAHSGQKRRGGEDYIEHPRRVAESCGIDHKAACVAWLHDVIEDSDLDLQKLMDSGVNEEAAKCVDELSKRDGESYESYLARIKDSCRITRTVKICDVVDNLTSAPTAKQITKYRVALLLLADACTEDFDS